MMQEQAVLEQRDCGALVALVLAQPDADCASTAYSCHRIGRFLACRQPLFAQTR